MERDENGKIKPHNDASIPDDSKLLRGVVKQYHVVPDENTGRMRISSAFLEPSTVDRDPYEGLSVDVQAKMDGNGADPTQIMKARVLEDGTPAFQGVISLKAAAFRTRSFLVGYEPMPGNEYHGAVWQTAVAKLTKSKRKALLKEAEWFIVIPDTDIAS